MVLLRRCLVVIVLTPLAVLADEPEQPKPALQMIRPQTQAAPPDHTDQPPLWDSYAEFRSGPSEQAINLDGRFYRADATKAALAMLPQNLPLGPPDLADYNWQDRMEALGAFSRAIGSTPRFNAEIAGLKCAGGGLLFMTCKVPDTSCAIVVALIIVLGGCSF